MAAQVDENLATQLAARMVALVNANDPSGFPALFAEDVRRVDYRRGITAEDVNGREAYVAYFEASLASGFVSGTVSPVATYDDRHALVRGSWGNGEGMYLDFLMVMVTNEAGEALFMGHYDPEDTERALKEIWAMYAGSSHSR